MDAGLFGAAQNTVKNLSTYIHVYIYIYKYIYKYIYMYMIIHIYYIIPAQTPNSMRRNTWGE